MRQITSHPCGESFESWQKKAAIARASLIAQCKAEHESAIRENRPFSWKPKFNEALYKELRQLFLFEAFHCKCAYCERNHSDGYPVQVEHYRPKGGVTEGGNRLDHLGYFWLAYEWWNLLPACAHCNTGHTDPVSGARHPGKKNEFPIQGARVAEPSEDPNMWQDEVAAENALLLNPYFDRPEDEIDFDPLTGAAIPKSPRGKATIELCDLSRASLREKRLGLRIDTLDGMIFRLMNNADMDSVVPPSSELSQWRKCLLQHRLVEMCMQAGLIVKRSE